jgi:predicted glycosyltransferase
MSPTVWIDIENPPQVQYLLPFREALARQGLDTVITTRDHDATLQMLEDAGVAAHAFGAVASRKKLRKLAATARRARDLTRFIKSTGRPVAQLGASRAAVIAAWRLSVPSFVIVDYEHVFLRLYRLTGSKILFPEVIDPAHFHDQGLKPGQLVPFRGVKEDLTFAGVDLDAVPPLDLGRASPKVLCRPPSETSHYYREGSKALLTAALARLAQLDAQIILAPRAPSQAALLHNHDWKHEPIILNRPVPFVSLLKSVDAVVCSGGTMLREAAYLGIPAYSVLENPPGAVDLWLERIGRAKLLTDATELDPTPRGALKRLDSNPELLSELAAIVAQSSANQVQARPLERAR